jgi:hypothetical protein
VKRMHVPGGDGYVLIPAPTSNNWSGDSGNEARLAPSVERETLISISGVLSKMMNRPSQGCGFDPHVGLNARLRVFRVLFLRLFPILNSCNDVVYPQWGVFGDLSVIVAMSW